MKENAFHWMGNSFPQSKEDNCMRYSSYDSILKATEDKSLLSTLAAPVLNLS